jgi:hypothetical protein
MWVPGDAAEIEEVVGRGDLEETVSFDGKASLPVPKKNGDLAIDVAAMSTEGGSLLYGVEEDEHERLTCLTPIALAGAADRIGQIVSTSIVEVPYIEVSEHPRDEDPSTGYISVLVPQSPRAPHQVIVGGDRRFYGRGAKGNRRLGESEIAGLYRRRNEWEQDRELLLRQTIDRAPFEPDPKLAFVHAFARPLVPDTGLWDRATERTDGSLELRNQLREAAGSSGPAQNFAPSLRDAANWRRRGPDTWLLSSDVERDRDDSGRARRVVDARIDFDGSGELYCGRAGERQHDQITQTAGELVVFEGIIAGNLASFLALIGAFHRLAGYHGHVDVGVAVTGLRGTVTTTRQGGGWTFSDGETFDADEFRRTTRCAAEELIEPEPVVRELLRHLFEATTGRADFDPFA